MGQLDYNNEEIPRWAVTVTDTTNAIEPVTVASNNLNDFKRNLPKEDREWGVRTEFDRVLKFQERKAMNVDKGFIKKDEK